MRPDKSEYFEYYEVYVGKVPDGDILEILQDQSDELVDLLRGLPQEKEGYRYAEGKWTLREVLGHVVDVERVFSYRALSFSRADANPIPGMEQDEWVRDGNFEQRTVGDLVDEFRHLRAANLQLFRSFDEEILSRSGEASGYRFTVRSILYILAGHALHHIGVLRERYL